MGEAADFIIGSDVTCSDGHCGELKRVVIDPVARSIAHVVVAPKHRGTARLVPVRLVASSTAKEIRLSCTKAQFRTLEDFNEKRLLPGAHGAWGFEDEEMHSLPYFGLGLGPMGGVGGLGGVGMGTLGKGMGMGRGHKLAGGLRRIVFRWVRSRSAAASTSSLPTVRSDTFAAW